MPIRIDQRIVAWEAVGAQGLREAALPQAMDERVLRPQVLEGRTYKIKTPLSEHALYLTINDIVLNAGTPYEQRRPFEVFINSKNMDHFQWIVALTRILSAVFRKGGDCAFLVDELHSVFDPRGGYFKRGGRFIPSLVSEIGDVLETHLRSIGLMPGADETPTAQGAPQNRFSAPLCPACNSASLVTMDGCATCVSCGESSCG
jgi:hypothetical protein